MAWFEDLTPCDYFGEASAPILRAVGWLEQGKQFTTGDIDRKVYDKLADLRRSFAHCHWVWMLRVTFFGKHTCDLCANNQQGDKNLFIPSNDGIYVAPELIIHYIDAHTYLPPTRVCAAVLKCPTVESKAYVEALLSCGGGPLLGTDPFQTGC
jgi:hypothetical protein